MNSFSAATRLFLSIAGVVLTTARVSAAPAEAAEPAPIQLSLPEAMDRAVKTVPQLALAERRVAEALATGVGAGIRLPGNPRLQFDVRPMLESSRFERSGFAAQLDVPFEISNAAGARVDEAGQRVEVARAEGEVSRLDARLLVMRVYLAMKTAELRIGHARQAVSIGERLKHVAKERQAAGAGSDIEVMSAQVERTISATALIEAEADRFSAETTLRFLLAIDHSIPVVLSTAIDEPPALPVPAVLVEFAQHMRPDLAVIQRRIALLEASDTRLRREAHPRIGAFTGIDAAPESPRFGFVGLTVDLPVAQRNQGPRAVVAATRQSEETLLDVERRSLKSGIASQHARYEARRQQVELLTQEGLPAAARRLALVETGWQAGRFDVFRVTTAAHDLVRLRDQHLVALVEAWNARIVIERLTGGWPALQTPAP